MVSVCDHDLFDILSYMCVWKKTNTDLVDVTRHFSLVSQWRVAVFYLSGVDVDGICDGVLWRLLVDIDVIWVDAFSGSGKPIIIQDFKPLGKLFIHGVFRRCNEAVVPVSRRD